MLFQPLEIVSDKWATSVIYVLSLGKKRYSELQYEPIPLIKFC